MRRSSSGTASAHACASIPAASSSSPISRTTCSSARMWCSPTTHTRSARRTSIASRVVWCGGALASGRTARSCPASRSARTHSSALAAWCASASRRVPSGRAIPQWRSSATFATSHASPASTRTRTRGSRTCPRARRWERDHIRRRSRQHMTAIITQDVPLVDLRAQYATIRDEVRKAIDEVLESMQLTIGPNVRAFDEEFARYIGAKHAVGVGSGTDALQLAIRACGVSSGDEVITVSFTFFATVEAILYANARPILVEIDEETMLMDTSAVAAAILRIKLRKLPEWNARRREIARIYDRLLQGTGIRVPQIPPGERHVFYVYCIRVPGGRRDALRGFLADRGIGTQIHYPVPIHLQQSAEFLGYRKGDLPITERFADEVLSIPMYPELTDEQIDRVTTSIREFAKSH